MANIKSQIKRIKTNEKARLRNQSVKSELKTYVRRVREAVEAGVEVVSFAPLSGTLEETYLALEGERR